MLKLVWWGLVAVLCAALCGCGIAALGLFQRFDYLDASELPTDWNWDQEVEELWEAVAGNWRCLGCDPPTTAGRLRKLAVRLR